jgi:endonuclease/exonuclease/phosphatase family metal-dependent hydrolase
VFTIASFNMHCGIDGWGRPYDAGAVIEGLDADVTVLQESWTSAGEAEGQAEQIGARLGATVVTHTLGEGRRIRPQPGATDKWVPPRAWSADHRPLYFDGLRPQPDAVQALERWREAERGTWGIGVLVRPGIVVEDWRVLTFAQLRRDPVRRAALVLDVTVDGHRISVAGTHMPHLHFGSHRTWAQLRAGLDAAARPDAVLCGDMNTWGPLVGVFIPGWKRAVVGRTWPAWSPHSQIDHILVRGALRASSGQVLPHAGSDHRPVRARIEVG